MKVNTTSTKLKRLINLNHKLKDIRLTLTGTDALKAISNFITDNDELTNVDLEITNTDKLESLQWLLAGNKKLGTASIHITDAAQINFLDEISDECGNLREVRYKVANESNNLIKEMHQIPEEMQETQTTAETAPDIYTNIGKNLSDINVTYTEGDEEEDE